MSNCKPVEIGSKYGRLTILKEVQPRYTNSGNMIRQVECQCDCGNKKVVNYYELKRNNNSIQSCGCLNSEVNSKKLKEYNKSDAVQKNREIPTKYTKLNKYDSKTRERLYNTWRNMKKRCYEPASDSYKYYGAKGIKVCIEWENDFENFALWALSHGYTNDLTIDRLDANGDYCPENCKWSTPKEQLNHTSRNKYIKARDGQQKTISEWADYYQIPYSKMQSYSRSKKYTTIEDIVEKYNLRHP